MLPRPRQATRVYSTDVSVRLGVKQTPAPIVAISEPAPLGAQSSVAFAKLNATNLGTEAKTVVCSMESVGGAIDWAVATFRRAAAARC